MIKNIVSKSKEYFDSGFGCAEIIPLSVSESRNIKYDFITKIPAVNESGF